MDGISESKYKRRDPEIVRQESERRYSFFVEHVKSDFILFCRQINVDCYPIIAGSVAAGFAGENSDIDICVVQNAFRDKIELQEKLTPWAGKWLRKKKNNESKYLIHVAHIIWVTEDDLKKIIELDIDKVDSQNGLKEALDKEILQRETNRNL